MIFDLRLKTDSSRCFDPLLANTSVASIPWRESPPEVNAHSTQNPRPEFIPPRFQAGDYDSDALTSCLPADLSAETK